MVPRSSSHILVVTLHLDQLIIEWIQQEVEHGFTGNVLLACDFSPEHKNQLNARFPMLKFYTTDFAGSPDILADITHDDWVEKVNSYGIKFSMVVSIATLEHVVDPFGMMKNIFLLVDKAIVHSVWAENNQVHAYHQNPIDCYRFMDDWPEAVAKRLGLKIRHKKWEFHFYVFFEK